MVAQSQQLHLYSLLKAKTIARKLSSIHSTSYSTALATQGAIEINPIGYTNIPRCERDTILHNGNQQLSDIALI